MYDDESDEYISDDFIPDNEYGGDYDDEFSTVP